MLVIPAARLWTRLVPGIGRKSLWRAFGSAQGLSAKPLPPRPTVEEVEIEENFLKGSGPGGQKIVSQSLINIADIKL